MTLLVVALVLAGLWLVVGPQLIELARRVAEGATFPPLDRRHVGWAAIVAAAALLWVAGRQPQEPTPAPGPAPAPSGLDLRGAFVGPSAAADAAKVAALMEETAAELEWDGMQADPFLKTGVSTDELRVRMYDLRCRGVSLGDRHPRARDAIRGYLDATAGKSGGPLSPAQRAAWVSAYREVARAAEATYR